MEKLTVLGIGLLLAACGPVGMLPGPVFSDANFPPDGPPNYQQGMIEGCKTALTAQGGAGMNFIYNEFYYDVDKALTDKVYYKAWKDGYFYCKYEFDTATE